MCFTRGPRRTGGWSQRTSRSPNERQSKVSRQQNEQPAHVHVQEVAKNPRESCLLCLLRRLHEMQPLLASLGPKPAPSAEFHGKGRHPVLPATTPGYRASLSPARHRQVTRSVLPAAGTIYLVTRAASSPQNLLCK